MKIFDDFNLKNYNSFRVNAFAKKAIILENANDLNFLHQFVNEKYYLLGEGSNILIKNHILDIVFINKIKGVTIHEEDDYYLVESNSGENWHSLVTNLIQKGINGSENLALIPGTVGAAPVQNIGAYGSEVSDCINSVQFYDFSSNQVIELNNSDCKFNYRDSIFKNELKNKGIITKVIFKFNKNAKVNIKYKDIILDFEKNNIANPTALDVYNTVCKIRQSKLPLPEKLGNAGSFFKNPIITINKSNEIKNEYPDVSLYSFNENLNKISAGWLIEKSGLKGFRKGDASIYENHALVLVNYGNASGQEIYDLSQYIIEQVYSKFNVTLEREVNII